jgi:hypothetical protein
MKLRLLHVGQRWLPLIGSLSLAFASSAARAQDPVPAASTSEAPKPPATANAAAAATTNAAPAATTNAPAAATPVVAAKKKAAARKAPPAAASEAVPAAVAPPAPEPPAAKPAPAVASTAPLAAPTCSQDQIDTVINGLNAWARSYRDNEKNAYDVRQCQRADVLCLNRFGQATDDKAPERIVAGRGLSVFAIVPSVDTAKLVVSTGSSIAYGETAYNAEVPSHPSSAPGVASSCELSKLQKEALHTAALPIAKLTTKPGLELLAIPAGSSDSEYWESTPDSQILKDWSIFVGAQGKQAPGFIGVGGRIDVQTGEVLSIDVSRTEKGARFPCAENHYEVSIDQGKYYLELALVAPFVYRGERNIIAQPNVGSRELRLAIEQDWHITAAAALDYFPAGRQRGQLSSFRNCRTRSCIENWLGIQAGLGLSSPFKEFYLGLVFEPVSGFNVGIGAALLKGEFLPDGRAVGMIVPAGDQDSAIPKYMFRPYIAVSITQDIFNSLERASSAARQLF